MSATAKKLNDDENELSFVVFNDGSSSLNLGVGFDAPTNLNIDAPPKKPKPQPEVLSHPPTQTQTIQAAQIPEVSLESALVMEPPPSTDHEVEQVTNPVDIPSFEIPQDDEQMPTIDLDPVNLIEQSKVRFKEIMSETSEHHLEPIETPTKPQPQGSLNIEDEPLIDESMVDSLNQLTKKYEEKASPLTGAVIHEDVTTTADRAGKAVNWWTQTFIVKPTSWIFRKLNNAVMVIIEKSFLLLLYVVMSAFATVVLLTAIFVIWGHYVGVPAIELAQQQYDATKEIVVRFYNDVMSKN
ncbi:hypothetical protein [Paenibacillus piri]|uniref:Uncharacterized protein n=1 Tax=Paenibacillus piri TaxID=2547395 RepID=A0A4V2ZUG4_9BACL|nr:hypothetical protein [Paenibacillus piri]TDG00895.1 hypothetical protein E1757_04595 [Paenibacillus piri]